jgi:hypothetical protein
MKSSDRSGTVGGTEQNSEPCTRFQRFYKGRDLSTKKPDANEAPGSEESMNSVAEVARHSSRLTVSVPWEKQT